MSLKEYVRKRDFQKTAEPLGRMEPKTSHPRFVIQKHAASRLHYDFRLELGGTLKSWAVPKGVPYRKGEKRLAVEVEDHPVSYIDFEGTIPKGQYGGGTVMVWDKGWFEPLSDAPLKELAGGKLHFRLFGKKLNGEWYLVRLRQEKQWLLIKAGENMEPVSAILSMTGLLSQEQDDGAIIARDRSVAVQSHFRKRFNHREKAPCQSFGAARVNQICRTYEKARLVESPPSGKWIYEIQIRRLSARWE